MLRFAELYAIDQCAQLSSEDATELDVSLVNGERLIGVVCSPADAGESNKEGADLAAMWERINPLSAADGWNERPTWFALGHIVTVRAAIAKAEN